MKNLIVILSLLLLVGCSGKPGLKDIEKVIHNRIVQNRSAYFMKVDSLQKINAIEGVLPATGQDYYDVHTKMKIWIIRECVWNRSLGFLAEPVLFTTDENDIVKPGSMFDYEKTFRFLKTENGWLAEDNNIY